MAWQRDGCANGRELLRTVRVILALEVLALDGQLGLAEHLGGLLWLIALVHHLRADSVFDSVFGRYIIIVSSAG